MWVESALVTHPTISTVLLAIAIRYLKHFITCYKTTFHKLHINTAYIYIYNVYTLYRDLSNPILVGEISPSVKITDILPETAPDRARQNETVESRLHGMVCVLLNLNEPQSMAMKLGEHLAFNHWIQEYLISMETQNIFLQTKCKFRFAARALEAYLHPMDLGTRPPERHVHRCQS